MARITYVKKAQQRYKTVPVLDEDGTPKRVPVMDKRTGQQKVTKRGKPVTMAVTVEDKTQPLPNRKCERCGVEIKPGDAYKHVTPKSGPYGGSKRVRCAACPTWQPWELTNAFWARIAQAVDGADTGPFDTADEYRAAAEALAEEVDDLAEDRREAAQNIEDGFGHPTSQSEEIAEMASSLDGWAETLRALDIEDEPDREDFEEGEEGEEEYQEAFTSWQENADSALDQAYSESPA